MEFRVLNICQDCRPRLRRRPYFNLGRPYFRLGRPTWRSVFSPCPVFSALKCGPLGKPVETPVIRMRITSSLLYNGGSWLCRTGQWTHKQAKEIELEKKPHLGHLHRV